MLFGRRRREVACDFLFGELFVIDHLRACGFWHSVFEELGEGAAGEA